MLDDTDDVAADADDADVHVRGKRAHTTRTTPPPSTPPTNTTTNHHHHHPPLPSLPSLTDLFRVPRWFEVLQRSELRTASHPQTSVALRRDHPSLAQ